MKNNEDKETQYGVWSEKWAWQKNGETGLVFVTPCLRLALAQAIGNNRSREAGEWLAAEIGPTGKPVFISSNDENLS